MTDKEAQLKAKLLKMKLAAKKSIPPSIIKRDEGSSELIESVMDKNIDKQYKKKGGMTEDEIKDMYMKPKRSDTKDPIAAMFLNEDVAKRLAKEARSKLNKLKKTPIKTMEKRWYHDNIIEDTPAKEHLDENQ
mgnify:FL=1